MNPKPLKVAEIILLVAVLGAGGWWVLKTMVTPPKTIPVNSPIFFPVQPTAVGERSMLTAGPFEGTLKLVNGCLRVSDYLVIWPPNFRLDESKNTIRVLNEKGQTVGAVGGKISLGGGIADEEPGDTFFRNQYKVPSQCASPFLLAGEVIR